MLEDVILFFCDNIITLPFYIHFLGMTVYGGSTYGGNDMAHLNLPSMLGQCHVVVDYMLYLS